MQATSVPAEPRERWQQDNATGAMNWVDPQPRATDGAAHLSVCDAGQCHLSACAWVPTGSCHRCLMKTLAHMSWYTCTRPPGHGSPRLASASTIHALCQQQQQQPPLQKQQLLC